MLSVVTNTLLHVATVQTHRQELPAVAETADCTALSRIAVLHADDGYSRRGNFGGSLVLTMFLMVTPDGINVCGSKGGEFEGR